MPPASLPWLWILVFLASSQISAQENALLQHTLDVLYEGENKFINFGHDQDFIIIHGWNEDNKSAILSSLISNYAALITRGPSFLPPSFYPQLVVHPETGTKFVDMTGKSNDGNRADFDERIIEIAANYFTHLVLQSAARVKFVFSLPLDSIYMIGINIFYLSYIVDHIDDLSEFSNSFAFVYTTNITTLPANFQEEFNSKFNEWMNEIKNMRHESHEGLENWSKFITLIDQTNSKFIVYNENDETSRAHFMEVIFNKLQFTSIADKSAKFGIFDMITSEMETSTFKEQLLVPFVNRMESNITSYIASMENEFRKNYESLFSDVTANGNKVLMDYKKIENVALDVNGNINEIRSICHEFSMNASLCNSDKITNTKYNKIFGFILDKDYNEITKNWIMPLKNFKLFLQNMRKWYALIFTLNNELSKYEFQISESDNLKNILDTNTTSGINITQFLGTLSREIPLFSSHQIQYDSINDFMLRDLIKVLTYHSQTNTKSTCVDGVFQVHGNFISLSDVRRRIESAECGNVTSVDVFARSAVFIDSDLRLPSKHLTIIAPEWQIIGQSSLNLGGNDAEKLANIKAQSGNTIAMVKGKDGLPGNHGENSGSFLGAALTVRSGEMLTILASGGQGSMGQDGGDGVNVQFDRTIPFRGTKHFNELEFDLRYKGFHFYGMKNLRESYWQQRYLLIDRRRLVFDYKFYFNDIPFNSAAHPGHGGVGGKGGVRGEITLKLLNKSDVRILNVQGTRGMGGKGGKAGSAGMKSAEILYKCTKSEKKKLFQSWKGGNISCEKQGVQGKSFHPEIIADGYDSYNMNGAVEPRQLEALNPRVKFELFKQFVDTEELPTLNVTQRNELLQLLQI